MEPMEFSGDAQAAFIGMGEGSVGQEVHDTGFKTGEGMENGGEGGLNGVFADGLSKQVGDDLADPVQGDELLAAQINQQGVESGSVLRLGVNPFRKFCRNFAAGGWAKLDLDPVFGDNQFLGRQIEDLSCFVSEDGAAAERSAATARATPQAMNNDGVGGGHFRQRESGMAGLSAREAVAFLAQVLGSGLGVTIGGRRFMAVIAVLGEGSFEFRHVLFQCREASFEPVATRASRNSRGGCWREFDLFVVHEMMLHKNDKKYNANLPSENSLNWRSRLS